MELNEEPTSHISSPYGRACANCARSKAKCIHGSGVDAKCGRCLRLNKDCQPTQSIRNRKTANRPSAAKAERLEAKLDGLYKLLQSSTTSTPIAGHPNPAPGASSFHQPLSHPLQTPATSPEDGEDFEPRLDLQSNWNRDSIEGPRLQSLAPAPDASYVVSGTRSTISHCPETSLINSSEPSFDEAEECLNFFRISMTTYFPFIIVSEFTTARDLRRDRPFLWLCIMSVTSKSTVQQKTLGREIKITMGREILVEGRSNIDLLMGLLVFVAWGHYHIYDGFIITQTTQLALALMRNLGLNKPPLKEPAQTVLNLDARGCPTKPFSPSIRTMEERRAVLGCFMLSSVVSAYFQRVDALRWTQYLDECIAVLQEKKECPTDTLLIHLVKLQLIVEKVGQAPWHDGHDFATHPPRTPAVFYLNALQAQLEAFKVNVHPDIQRNDIWLLHLYSTEVRIYDIALSKAPIDLNSSGFQRIDSLYACLEATKNWFRVFLDFPPALYVGLSIPTFTQMGRCIVSLFRLVTLEDPVWDRGLARETANLSHILEQIIQRFSQVKSVADLDRSASEDEDIFSRTAGTLRSTKTWWDAKLAAELANGIVPEETMGEANTELFDDVWLRDIFSQVDCQFDINMPWSSAAGPGV